MTEFDQDWWKTLFDETYLVTDARTVCDDSLTCREVDFLEEILQLETSWPILDLCGGQGRHALELSRRGFVDVTVLDFSEHLISEGRERAQREGLNTQFVQMDARNTGLEDWRFRVVMVMASSLGYFEEESQNKQILKEAFRLLAPSGILLLDLPNRDYVIENFVPQSWHEPNEQILVCRQRMLGEDIVYSRELVISKIDGLVRDTCYCTRLYSPEKITELLYSVGFQIVRLEKEFVTHEKKMDYGLMTNRMIVMAEKT